MFHGVMCVQTDSTLVGLCKYYDRILPTILQQDSSHCRLQRVDVMDFYWYEYQHWINMFDNGKHITVFSSLATTCKLMYNLCNEYSNPLRMSLEEKKDAIVRHHQMRVWNWSD